MAYNNNRRDKKEEVQNDDVKSENVGIKTENEGVEFKNGGVGSSIVAEAQSEYGINSLKSRNVVEESVVKLNKMQLVLIEILSCNSGSSAKEVSEMMSVTQRTIERNLSFLQKNGFIMREGSRRYGKWIVLKKK